MRRSTMRRGGGSYNAGAARRAILGDDLLEIGEVVERDVRRFAARGVDRARQREIDEDEPGARRRTAAAYDMRAREQRLLDLRGNHDGVRTTEPVREVRERSALRTELGGGALGALPGPVDEDEPADALGFEMPCGLEARDAGADDDDRGVRQIVLEAREETHGRGRHGH